MELLTIGRIAGSHHLKGDVKVLANVDGLDSLVGEKVLITTVNGIDMLLTISKAENPMDNRWIIGFEGITNKTDTEKLRGAVIKVNKDFFDMEEDEYFLQDLIGMNVIDQKTDEDIGKVIDVYDTAAHDILVVENDKYETMIPNIEEFVKDIDLDRGIIYVELIEGLKELKK